MNNRNQPCPCGSGNKYKKCCINKIVEAIVADEGRPWTADDVGRILVNPIYAISISPMLAIPNPEPLVSEEQWVSSNAKMIQNQGAEQWLRTLLDVLKGGYV